MSGCLSPHTGWSLNSFPPAELGNRLNLAFNCLYQALFSWFCIGKKCHVGLQELNEMKSEVYSRCRWCVPSDSQCAVRWDGGRGEPLHLPPRRGQWGARATCPSTPQSGAGRGIQAAFPETPPEFPADPVGKTPSVAPAAGLRIQSWWGAKILHASRCSQKKKCS